MASFSINKAIFVGNLGKDPEVKEKFLSNGLEIVGGTPKEFSDYIHSEIIKWKKIIVEANIKLD